MYKQKIMLQTNRYFQNRRKKIGRKMVGIIKVKKHIRTPVGDTLDTVVKREICLICYTIINICETMVAI